jgi:antitoxin Phd
MTWALQDAKARFSELVRRALSEGAQRVTVRGKPSLVVLSEADYARLVRRRKRLPLAEVFKESPVAGDDLQVERSRHTGRAVRL